MIKKYVKTAIAGVLVLSLVLQAFYGMQYVLASEENTELTSPQSYTIKLTNATQVFIYNERETTAYPITLRYTVASAEQNCYKTGAIATEEPEATIPYENQKGSLVSNGRVFTSKQGVYEIQLQKTSENVIQYSGTLKKNDDSSVDLTANYSNVAHSYAGVPNSNATHFGIWIDKDTTNTNQTDAGETAILTNVTCVDAEGNDLGVLAKAGTGTYELIKNEAESYTVAMDSATQVFISNKSPAEAYPITLKYTVAYATKNCYQTGVMATESLEANPLYTKGQLRHNGRFLTSTGGEYHIDMSKDSNGQLVFSGGLARSDATTLNLYSIYAKTITNGTVAGPGNTNASYFGIWFDTGTQTGTETAGPETAILTNVTCVDANGNDLGVIAQAASGICSARSNTVDAESYTVTLTDASHVFICNDKAPTKYPVTLTYTVQSSNKNSIQSGVIATTTPDAEYPYKDNAGSMKYWTWNRLLNEGATYTFDLTLNENQISYMGTTQTINGTPTILGHTNDNSEGTGNADSTYFGIWLTGGLEDAVLTNVSCVDATGSDLGVKVKTDTGTCEAIKHETVTLDAKYETYQALPYLLGGTGDLTVNGEAKENGHELTQVGDYDIQWDYYGRITKQKIVIYQLGNAHLDEYIDVCDLVAIKKEAKEADKDYLDTEAAMLGADVTQDEISVVNDDDVTMMRKVLVGTVTLDEPAAVSYALNDTSVMPIAGYSGPCG